MAILALGLAALAFFSPRGFFPWAPRGVSPAEETDGEASSPRVAVVTVNEAVWRTLPLSAAERAVFTVKTPQRDRKSVV